MRKVEQIEQQIRELSAGDFSELRDWIIEQDWKLSLAQAGSAQKRDDQDRRIIESESDASGQSRSRRDP
jgi:hypothetical protein